MIPDQNTKIENKESKIEGNIQVYERGSFVKRITELPEIKEEYMEAIVAHLYLRRALNIGDSGLHNMLLVE